jgi:hypothetical protein
MFGGRFLDGRSQCSVVGLNMFLSTSLPVAIITRGCLAETVAAVCVLDSTVIITIFTVLHYSVFTPSKLCM